MNLNASEIFGTAKEMPQQEMFKFEALTFRLLCKYAALLFLHIDNAISKGRSGRQILVMWQNQSWRIAGQRIADWEPADLKDILSFYTTGLFFLDAIASTTTYPCQSVGESVNHSFRFGDSYRISELCKLSFSLETPTLSL